MTEIQEAFHRLAPHLVDFRTAKDGTIEYADRRFVFFHTKMFSRLFKNMKDVAGPVIDTEIEQFGHQAGKTIARKMDNEFRDTSLLDAFLLLIRSGFDIESVRTIAPKDDQSQMEKIFGLGMYDGWVGPIEIESFDPAEKKAVFRAKNTFESDSHGETGEKECKFVPGVIKGILEYYWDDKDLIVEELQCRCEGADMCQLRIQQSE